MSTNDVVRLRLLAAELRDESARTARTIDELNEAAGQLNEPEAPRLYLYAAAALLETFYTGIEKALARIAGTFGGLPRGDGWHRQLLKESALDIPGLRPPVLRPATVKALDAYLAFRHRFRNLYLFDLEPTLILPLLGAAPTAWEAVRADLAAFAAAVLQIAADSGSSSHTRPFS